MTSAEYINAAGGFDGMKPPRSKYRNKPTVVDGIRFSSKAEARRWDELRILEKAGEITDLKRQVSFPLYAQGDSKVGDYVADFVYLRQHFHAQELVVEDCKGVETQLFKWKSRHFMAQYGYPISIVKAGRR